MLKVALSMPHYYEGTEPPWPPPPSDRERPAREDGDTGRLQARQPLRGHLPRLAGKAAQVLGSNARRSSEAEGLKDHRCRAWRVRRLAHHVRRVRAFMDRPLQGAH